MVLHLHIKLMKKSINHVRFRHFRYAGEDVLWKYQKQLYERTAPQIDVQLTKGNCCGEQDRGENSSSQMWTSLDITGGGIFVQTESQARSAKPLSRPLKTFFGIGDFGFTLMTNIDTFYASYFFINIALLPLATVSVITTISAVVDLILSCLYGAWMNKIKPGKWGRYRSWLVLTPWMVPFLYMFEFVKLGNTTVMVVVMTIAMITSRIAWNIPYIANISMINIAGKTTEDRMALSSIRNVWTALGSVVYSYLGPMVVAGFTAVLSEKNAYAATAFVFGAFMAAAYFAHFKMFKGYEETGEEELARIAKQKQAESAPKVSAIAAVRCNPHLLALMLSSTTKYMVLFLVNGIAIYYFQYIALKPAMFAAFMLITNLLGVLASYISRFFVARAGAKKTVVCAYLIMGIAMLAAFVIYEKWIPVIILMAVTFFAMNITTTCDPELFATCAQFSSAKTGFDTTGTVMGLLTVPVKFGIVMRGILISAALAIGGFSATVDPSQATEQMKRGICIGFMIIPALVVIAGAVILAFGYRLGRENTEK